MSFQSFAQSSPASNGVSRRSHQYVVARENEHAYVINSTRACTQGK